MSTKAKKTLRAGHRKALGLAAEPKFDDAPPVPREAAAKYYARQPLLQGIPAHIVRTAWFTMSHLLLQPGAHVADMGCGDGMLTYAMAALNPELQFCGIDRDPEKIAAAAARWTAPNLTFKTTADATEKEYFDTIINSFTLHNVYAEARHNDQEVRVALEQQFVLLKQEGWHFIRDYALHRPATDYVLLEMPASTNGSTDIQTMTETDLLIWFAHNARPLENSTVHGFFLEELTAHLPDTRLFRLPFKWAYEFIIRKDDRVTLEAELHKEYTFFTEQEFNKNLRNLDARAVYNAPHWDEDIISKRFDGRFRLFDDEGRPLGSPPTSFVALSQKVGAHRSLALQERRPSQKKPEKLRVTAMHNNETGRIIDIVSRDIDLTEIIPYRVAGDNQLHVFIHDGLPRGIVNAVPRKGKNIDGRVWSGHMVEAITVPSHIVHTVDQGLGINADTFARDYLGLRAAIEAPLEQGQSYYPSPDLIDELIKTRYLRVREQPGSIEPKVVIDDIQGFTTLGRVRELNAQKILDAIAVGLIPNSRLELQLLSLFEKHGLHAESWDECPLVLEESDPGTLFDAKNHMKLKAAKDSRLKPAKAPTGQLRSVQSTFVDEGRIEGNITGLASRDMEFIVSDENTVNRAVVMLLTKQAGQVLVGMEVDYLPVPQRLEGNGLMARAPCVNLPKEITTIYQAREFIADMFKVKVENVSRLGESYFCHAGVTSQRIFPFAVATKGKVEMPTTGPVQFGPLKYVINIFNNYLWKSDQLTMLAMTRVRRRLVNHDMSMQLVAGFKAANSVSGPTIMNVSAIEPPKKNFV